MKFCYQCDAQVTYLFADARCAKCTRLTPEEVRGEPKENDMRERQEKWDMRYVRLAQEVATWSKDPSTKVGAVLVRPNNSVASTGFNGFPPGQNDHPELYADRSYKYRHVVHAEVNALEFLTGETPHGFTLYTSFPCCPNCMEAAAKAGVTTVVFPPVQFEGKDQQWIDEWSARIDQSLEVARRFDIKVRWVDV